jgi:hypothetical protein
MATMKKTLLEIVQDILNDLDSDAVTAIGDTIEATQVANISLNTLNSSVSLPSLMLLVLTIWHCQMT